ncbi:MAG: TrkA family potassium uptake protein, partial [Planctomycetes bacterium]|nr:TrkA family potassium uptake protein [Planctomycetota bacterium]
MQKVAVIGLGRFGMVLARQLAASGVEVIAIDRSQNLVNEIKDDVDVAVRLDSTDESALRSQDVHKVDVCVVAVGENFEAALLTTVIARKIGVPRVICRAQTEFHKDIFHQIGADEVIQPETQAGEQLARKLANPHIKDFISLAEG